MLRLKLSSPDLFDFNVPELSLLIKLWRLSSIGGDKNAGTFSLSLDLSGDMLGDLSGDMSGEMSGDLLKYILGDIRLYASIN
jgi:hypothetical protein